MRSIRALASLLLLFSLVACSEQKSDSIPAPKSALAAAIDGSSDEAFSASIDRIRVELPKERLAEFDQAFGDLVLMHTIHFASAETKGKVINEYIREQLKGKTADEVISERKQKHAAVNEASSALKQVATAPRRPQSAHWKYETVRDAMREKDNRFAHLFSENDVTFASPYDGGSFLQLSLRHSATGERSAYFYISRGQIHCSSLSNCQIAVKFDSGPVQMFNATISDQRHDVIFIDNDKKFVKQVMASKRMAVEAEFYQQGLRQFTFNTGNLDWK